MDEIVDKPAVRKPQSLEEAEGELTWVERQHLRFARRTFRSPWIDRGLSWVQRVPQARLIDFITRPYRHVLGIERIPYLGQKHPMIIVSNHRSFFDMYTINTVLFGHGHRGRAMFPVRSNFFYDHPIGFVVNGLASCWSMYPPVFRDRRRAPLNKLGLDELVSELHERNRVVGIHPEGHRNKGPDPYTFLPPQSGVGRLIHLAKAPVIPVFINGLGNNFLKQSVARFTAHPTPLILAFGKPVDFADLLEKPANGATFKQVAERAMTAVAQLGEEERAFRAQLNA